MRIRSSVTSAMKRGSRRTGKSATGTAASSTSILDSGVTAFSSAQVGELTAVNRHAHRLLEQYGGKVRGILPERCLVTNGPFERVPGERQVTTGSDVRIGPGGVRPRRRNGGELGRI